MHLLARAWSFAASHRLRIVALLVLLALIAPHPAEGQFGLISGLIGIVTSGLNTLNNVMTTVNNTLRNVIGPILQGVNSAISAARQIMGAIFDFQRNVVYPQQAINDVRALIGRVQGIYKAIRGIWKIVARSATLPNPRQLEAVILSPGHRRADSNPFALFREFACASRDRKRPETLA